MTVSRPSEVNRYALQLACGSLEVLRESRHVSRPFRSSLVVRSPRNNGWPSPRNATSGVYSVSCGTASAPQLLPQSPSGAPTPSAAPEGGEVLAAGRARELAANRRDQPQALERISVSDAGDVPPLGSGASQPGAAGKAGFHTKRHRPYFCLQLEIGGLPHYVNNR